MKTARVIKLWSKHNLPSDLLPEILSRLPVKSLLRFRCVSKSWLSLIDDPNFCLLHLNNFKNNCNETHLFVVQYQEGAQNYVVRSSSTFKTTTRLDYLDTVNGSCQTFTTSHILRRSWRALCSVGGLVMLKHLTTPIELIMWNPSIRRARTLPPSPTISEGMINVDLGFGYCPLLKDYKHVRFVQCGRINLHSVAVYTFRPGSWKTIKFQGKGISNWRWSFPDVEFKWKTVYLRGDIYFTPWKLYSEPRELVAFDLRDEVFASTSLLAEGDLSSKGRVDKALLLLDDGSTLGVIYCVPTQGSIWVLESSEGDIVSKCWTMRYTFASGIRDSKAFDARYLYFRHLKKNGDMILKYNKQLTSYNPESDEEKIMLANSRDLSMPDVWGYTESLLML